MEKTFKIASFNIQSFHNYPVVDIDQKHAATVINRHKPDFVGLNEVSAWFDYPVQPESIAKETGYSDYFYAPILELKDRLYGNGLLSSYPIKYAEMIPIPKHKNLEQRCILKAELDVASGLTVFVTHFGLTEPEQEESIKLLCELIGENPKKTVLMGDFNLRPNNELLNPLKEILVDTAEGYAEEELLTWPSIDGQRKIDYIFVSPDFKILKTYTADEIGSDHKMILTELVLERE